LFVNLHVLNSENLYITTAYLANNMRHLRFSLLVFGLLALAGAQFAPASVFAAANRSEADDDATYRALLWTEDDFNAMTVIDANNDGYTWTYYDDEAAARIRANRDGETPKDDWLITPGLQLQAGREYRVTLDVRARKGDAPETFELKMGREATADAMTATLIEPTAVVSLDGIRFVAVVTIEEDGTYYIGTHAISDPGMSYFYFDYLAVSAPIDLNAPEAVANIELTPDADGAASMKMQFLAPTLSVAGAALTTDISVDIKRDDLLVATLENIAPGSTVTYADEFADYEGSANSPVGYHTWTFIPRNESGGGHKNSATAYVGINKPSAPTNVVAVETETVGEVTISWEAPSTDVDGYPLNPDKVTYTITEYITGVDIAADISSLSYTYRAVGEGETQDFRRYIVTASTEGGVGGYASSQMIAVGPAFTVPFHESLADGHVESLLGITTLAGSPAWYLLNDDSFEDIVAQDEDNGMIGMYGTAVGTSGMLYTGKISLAEVAHPIASLYTYPISETDENTVGIVVICDGEESLVEEIAVNDLIEDDLDWVKLTADLSEYSGKTIELGVVATLVSHYWVLLDNINIEAESSAIESVCSDNAEAGAAVSAEGSTLRVDGEGNYRISVAYIAGRRYFNGLARLPFNLTVAPGVYIVTIGNTPHKLAVR
jgi:hypothetical protein